MNLHIRPILSALLRNRVGALLVAMQIAIALAVLVNAVYIVKQRVDEIGRPTGMDIENMFAISSDGFGRDFDYEATIREDLAYLRSVPGVVAATASNAVPLSGGGSSEGLTIRPDDMENARPAGYFEVDHQGVETLGLKLIAGKPFGENDILPPRRIGDAASFVPQIIVTRAYAEALFPDGNALGKTVYNGNNQPAVITGIIEHMHGSWVNWGTIDHVFLSPRVPVDYAASNYYLVRTRPGERDAVMKAVEAHITTSNPQRVIDWIRPMEYFKNRSYLADRNMAIFLVAVTTLLIGITALGIFGLATFNVSTRTKQIGTRRAIGARQADIVRYFLIENGLITTAGIVVGCAAALAVGVWLSLEYQLPRLDLYYLVGGVLGLWALGQAAVWQPARRAATISPSVATRTV